MASLFIDVEVAPEVAGDREYAAKLEEVCPVDIYAVGQDGGVAIVVYTEPGGRMEAELARWTSENQSRLPIVAFMAGKFMDEMPGMSFGHAGTIVEGKEDTATEKISRLESAGIPVVERIDEIPDAVREKLGQG